MTESGDTMRRFDIASRYMNNQTPESWRAHTRAVMNEARSIVDDEIEHAALGILRASYWQSVRSYADEIVRDAIDRADEITDRDEWLDTTIHEYADGSQWIIYHWRARLVLLASDHANEHEDAIDFREAGSLDNVLAMAAYLAMRADIAEVVAKTLGLMTSRLAETEGSGTADVE